MWAATQAGSDEDSSSDKAQVVLCGDRVTAVDNREQQPVFKDDRVSVDKTGLTRSWSCRLIGSRNTWGAAGGCRTPAVWVQPYPTAPLIAA